MLQSNANYSFECIVDYSQNQRLITFLDTFHLLWILWLITFLMDTFGPATDQRDFRTT